jgi:cobalamin biosynthesis Co2+ chelatase CbiK
MLITSKVVIWSNFSTFSGEIFEKLMREVNLKINLCEDCIVGQIIMISRKDYSRIKMGDYSG